MAKLKVQETAKELSISAGQLLENVVRIKRSASDTLKYLQRVEAAFQKQEQQRREDARLERQRELIERQSSAWIMSDPTDEPVPVEAEGAKQDAPAERGEIVVSEAAAVEPNTVQAVSVDEPRVEARVETRAVEVAAAEKVGTDSDSKASSKEIELKTVKARAEQAAKVEAVPETSDKPQGTKSQATEASTGSSTASQTTSSATSVEKPKQKAESPKDTPKPQKEQSRANQPPRPNIPEDQRATIPAGYPLKPGIQGRTLPPKEQRPLPPRPQSGQPHQFIPNTTPPRPGGPIRPATPPAQTGTGARPFTPNPQGRPFTPATLGQRPFTPGGQGARPFTPAGQGGFNRPFTPGAPRPQGAAGARPPMGGAPRPGGLRKPDIAPAAEKERVSNYDPNKKMYQRQHDPERISKNRKQLARETGIAMQDDDVMRGRKGRKRATSAQQMMDPIRIDKAYMTAETITVKDLSERIGKTAGEIMKKLLLLGTMATINQELDFDTAQLVCSEFGVDFEMKLDKTAEDILIEGNAADLEENLVLRSPVVTIMGHVDHGKTTLLDFIRKTRVAEGEAGGITQHIGAYTVDVAGKQITFLDTPGHEAFTAMRARGAMATDIAILVVAADDGVMPQTVEAINHAKTANVPIIVAITKIDKFNANVDKIKQDLTNRGLVPEEWGGDTIMTPVSAHTGENIQTLLEMIILVADVAQLRANPNRLAKGVIIEAKLDKGKGPVATALVQNGTLRVGDTIVAGTSYGRVRAMINDRGQRVDEAGPSVPVEIIGFGEVPDAGDEIMAVEDDRLSRLVAEERKSKVRVALVKSSTAKVSLDDLFTQISQGEVKDLNLIVKADVQGSVEAVKQSLERLSGDEVRVRVIHGGVGAITENDVMLAMTASAIIIGFNVRPDGSAGELAKREEIDVRLYRVIYDAINDVEKAMKGLLAPQFKEVSLGKAQVRMTFRVTGVGMIAGCYVTEGKIQRNAMARLIRDNVTVFEGKISSLKHLKDDAREIAQGFECGIGLERFNDVKEGDEIECFNNEEIAR